MDNQKMNNNRPDQDPEGGNNKKDDMNKKSLLVMVVLAIAVMIIAQMLSGKIASEGSDIYRIYAGCQGWKGDEGGTGFGPHLL